MAEPGVRREHWRPQWIFAYTALYLVIACYFGFNFLFGDELPYTDGQAGGGTLLEEELVDASLRQLLVKVPNYPKVKPFTNDSKQPETTSYYDDYLFLDRHCTQTMAARRPMFDKMALFIIDALRVDFVPTVIARDLNEPRMPYMERMLKQHGIGLVSIANIPTVTMPRVKALLSGALPSFMDYIFNLNVQRFKGDNIIEQMWRRNKRINFYGDDTWGKLFPPEMFADVNLTSSLFATDYTYVDTNVTWNVKRQLQQLAEWDVMIMHYLGVDHIGHLQGYNSELFPKKLQEMDSVFRMVFDALSSNRNSTYLVVVTGDHGMTDSGNHGGNTRDETHTALLFLSTNPEHHRFKPDLISQNANVVQQIDFAPTISALFNMNMTAKSEGCLASPVLDRFGMSDQEHLCHLFRNALQMHRTMLRRHNEMTVMKSTLLEAIKAHHNFVKKNNTGDSVHETTQHYLYNLARNRYQTWIKDLQNNHVRRVSNRSIFSIMPMCIVICFLVVIILLAIEYRNKQSIFFSGLTDFRLLSPLLFFDTLVARVIDITQRRRLAIERGFSIFDCFLHLRLFTSTFGRLLLMFPFIANFILMGSTDWIEEEHRFWYTMTRFVLYTTFIVVVIGRVWISQSDHMLELVKQHYFQVISTLAAMILLFYIAAWWKVAVVHEADLKQPSDFYTILTAKGRKPWLTSAYLVSLIIIGFGVGWNIKDNTLRYIMGAGLFFSYLYRSSLGTISVFRFLKQFLNIFSRWPNLYAQLVYFFVSLLYGLLIWEWLMKSTLLGDYIRPIKIRFRMITANNQDDNRQHSKKKCYDLMNTVVVSWVMMSALLTPAPMLPVLMCNVILELMVDFVMSDPVILRDIAQDQRNIERRYRIVFTRLSFYVMMGTASYFHMGNTNSLSTISVQACFVGLSSYNLAYCGLFMTIATYSTYVFWMLRFFVWLQQDLFNYDVQNILPYTTAKKMEHTLSDEEYLDSVFEQLRVRILLNYDTLFSAINVVLLFRFAVFSMNMLVSFILRDHLFIWSVVCPKLLYEFAFTCVNYIFCLVIASIFHFDNSLLLR